MTVRKFGLSPLGPDDLVRLRTVSEETLDVLGRAVRERANILIPGGAVSGKTTLLGALASYILPAERIITIEDVAELRLAQPNLMPAMPP